MSWQDWPIPKQPYTEIPTFVIDEKHSAYEGEPMHCVGRLFRGDYYIDLALDLMAALNAQFIRNVMASGFDRESIQRRLDEMVQARLEKAGVANG